MKDQWEELLSQKERWSDQWILGGDFNVTLSPDERNGGEGNADAMDEFKSFVNEGQFADLPVYGGKYTWSNKRDPPICCRLDRFLVTGAVLEGFHDLTQKILSRMTSDHYPVVLALEKTDWGPRPFRLFSHWLDMLDFSDLIKGRWAEAQVRGNRNNLWLKLRSLRPHIRSWQKVNNINDPKELRS